MKLHPVLAVIFCLLFGVTVSAQNSSMLLQLEQKKAAAIAATEYQLAGEIDLQIKELKANSSKLETVATNKSSLRSKIKELEAQKVKAVAESNYTLAAELKAKITDMKANPSKYEAVATNKGALQSKIKELEAQKVKAVAGANYKLAGELKAKISDMKANPSKYEGEANSDNAMLSQMTDLEAQKAKAVADGDYGLAGEIKNKIINLKNQPPNSSAAQSQSQPVSHSAVNDNTGMRISKSGENEMAGIKYRRSSLYSIIRISTGAEQSDVIQEAFINAPISSKFNNHNLSLRVIPSDAQLTGEIAKHLVASWFNRDEQGRFDMELIKQRGLYNATNYDINIAKGSSRGMRLLEDAGEELLGNTFIIVNEFKYTNKEDVAKKAKKATRAVGFLASVLPGGSAISSVANIATVGLTVAGKGYWVKNTSHLYQLVWNDQIANEFYTKYWVDDDSYDQNKVAAFDNCNLFSLKYIGFENARADVQSSVFTSKSDDFLIAKATTKAVDNGIAKLERKFEQFRTKTPLYSVNPATAKIGLKEGLQPGDKFEVLEQVQDANGKIQYVRKGVITVDKHSIWDNTYSAEELVEAGKQPNQQNQFTVFKGASSKYVSGMLIRQIN